MSCTHEEIFAVSQFQHAKEHEPHPNIKYILQHERQSITEEEPNWSTSLQSSSCHSIIVEQDRESGRLQTLTKSTEEESISYAEGNFRDQIIEAKGGYIGE